MNALHRRLVVLCMVLTLIGGSFYLPVARAQDDGTLKFNEPVIATLNPGQTDSRTFSVLTGDNFELRLSPIDTFTYTAVLIDPSNAAIPLTPGQDGSVVYAVDSAPSAGTFTLALSAPQQAGQLLIQLSSSSVAPVPLSFGETTIQITGIAMRYDLTPLVGSGPTSLMLAGADANGLPGLTLTDATTGETILTLAPGMLLELDLTLPEGSSHILTLEPGEQPISVNMAWNEAPDSSQSSTSSDSQSSTSPVATSSAPSSSECQIVFSANVNLRYGPGVAYEPPLGSIPPGTTVPAIGRLADYSWYQINYGGQLGWVAGQIAATTTQGNCTAVPVVTPPPPPAGPTATYAYTTTTGPSPTPSATYTPGGPTATYTPSYTPTTPPAAQIAPNDTNYTLIVDLDSTESVTDFVSYPQGDVEDRVSYDVRGLNNSVAMPGGRAQFVIQATCFGEGTEHITFVADGQTYTCGSTVLDRTVNADSRTGAVTITAVGGDATYVQWVLTGTVTRLN